MPPKSRPTRFSVRPAVAKRSPDKKIRTLPPFRPGLSRLRTFSSHAAPFLSFAPESPLPLRTFIIKY